MEFNVIGAMQETDRGIGWRGNLPWPRIAADMKHFRQLTSGRGTVVIVGGNTWRSAGFPLKGRFHIVISRKRRAQGNGWCTVETFDEALQLASTKKGECWVIGGGQVYEMALRSPWCRLLYLTIIPQTRWPCDTYFPHLPQGQFSRVTEWESPPSVSDPPCRFQVWRRVA